MEVTVEYKSPIAKHTLTTSFDGSAQPEKAGQIAGTLSSLNKAIISMQADCNAYLTAEIEREKEQAAR
jgi:hypothetical protein